MRAEHSYPLSRSISSELCPALKGAYKQQSGRWYEMSEMSTEVSHGGPPVAAPKDTALHPTFNTHTSLCQGRTLRHLRANIWPVQPSLNAFLLSFRPRLTALRLPETETKNSGASNGDPWNAFIGGL